MAGVARARGRAPVDQRPCPGGRASHRRAAWHPVQRSPLGGAPGDGPHGRPARHPQPRRPHHLRADSGRRRPAGRHRPHRARHTPDPHQHLRGVSLRPAGDHRGGARHGHEQGPALLLHQGALGVPPRLLGRSDRRHGGHRLRIACRLYRRGRPGRAHLHRPGRAQDQPAVDRRPIRRRPLPHRQPSARRSRSPRSPLRARGGCGAPQIPLRKDHP